MLCAALSPDAPAWRPLGGNWADDVPAWATWVTILDDGGDALYRSIVVDEASIVVTVDLDQRHQPGMRLLHRIRGDLPPDRGQVGERVRELLAEADDQVRRAVTLMPQGARAAIGRASPPLRASSRQKGGHDDVSGASRDAEHRTRERAYLLWEREGRPEGRAEEFWAKAYQEEARAADVTGCGETR